MTTLHSSLGPNPRLVRMFLIEKGLVEGEDFQRVHYDIITGENRQDEAYLAKNPSARSRRSSSTTAPASPKAGRSANSSRKSTRSPTCSAAPRANAPKSANGCGCSTRKWWCR
nr:hypothetical protein [Erythrobacter sp. JK5]